MKIFFLGSLAKETGNMTDQKNNIPLFKSWAQWYVFVILFLVVLIILFWLFTKYFS